MTIQELRAMDHSCTEPQSCGHESTSGIDRPAHGCGGDPVGGEMTQVGMGSIARRLYIGLRMTWLRDDN